MTVTRSVRLAQKAVPVAALLILLWLRAPNWYANLLLNQSSTYLKQAAGFSTSIDTHHAANEALRSASDALGIANGPRALRAAGYAHLLRKEPDAATGLLQQHPPSAAELYQWSTVTDADEQIAWLQLAIAVDPSYTPPYTDLCRAYSNRQQFDEIVLLFEAAPTKAQAIATLQACTGSSFVILERPAEAIVLLNNAAAQEPGRDSTWQWLSLAYTQLGSYGEAIAASEQAVALALERPDYWHHLANLYRESDRRAEAIVAYRQLLILDPGNQSAHDALQQLTAP